MTRLNEAPSATMTDHDPLALLVAERRARVLARESNPPPTPGERRQLRALRHAGRQLARMQRLGARLSPALGRTILEHGRLRRLEDSRALIQVGPAEPGDGRALLLGLCGPRLCQWLPERGWRELRRADQLVLGSGRPGAGHLLWVRDTAPRWPAGLLLRRLGERPVVWTDLVLGRAVGVSAALGALVSVALGLTGSTESMAAGVALLALPLLCTLTDPGMLRPTRVRERRMAERRLLAGPDAPLLPAWPDPPPDEVTLAQDWVDLVQALAGADWSPEARDAAQLLDDLRAGVDASQGEPGALEAGRELLRRARARYAPLLAEIERRRTGPLEWTPEMQPDAASRRDF